MGFRLAKACGGLPLFIVLVAGMLKEKKMQANLWKEIEEGLDVQSMGSSSTPIIGFSYKDLPDYLKPCFLYFGGFLKGKDIHVSKLTRLWFSEGFVHAREDSSYAFLEDLISRNLVMGMKTRPNGKVKTCRVHDLLHQFCLEKAKEENFFLRVNRFSEEDMFPEKPEEYRLFIHTSQDQIDLWQPSCSNLRSIIFNAIDVDNLLWPCDFSFIFDKFKLIKVLDFESFNIGGAFPSELQSLVHMSYPAKLPHVFNFPSKLKELTLSKFRLPWSQISTIGELPNLESLKLVLRAFEGDEWEAKDSEFPKLKYLELDALTIARWSVSDDAFPILERLILTKCKQLEKVSSHFEEAVSLRSIEVNWCSWSVANSAQEIETIQCEEMANNAFTVTIQPPDWSRKLSP